MSKNKLYGVDDEKYDEAYNKPFEASSSVIESDKTTDNALSNLESLTSKEGIISDDVKNSLNVQFEMPKEVTAADGYLSSTLSKIQSGKTSYTDQVRDMMDKIMNRDKFSYDVDTDPLFQQALASSMNAGKQAMQDTIGQASSLTGGYGSTYATSAGNQAYNSFIEEAYDNLPQYYQMALEAYQMEGDEMYRQYGMLADADDREYNRNVTGFNSTLSYRNQIYNEAYGQYRDSKSDAFAMANLEISEHGQLVSDAYNYYNAASNYSDKLYEREYSKWADEVNMALKEVEMLNSDAWSEKNFDEGVRQYEKNFAENQRQYNESLAEQKRQHNETMSYNWASLNQKSGSGGGNGFELSTAEYNAAKKAFDDAGGGESGFTSAVNVLKAMGIDIDESNGAILMDALKGNDGAVSNVNTGTIDKFRIVEGDNFDVKVGDESYRVENHGKVTDSDTIKELNKKSVENNSAFIHDGEAYVKYGDEYYKIGATSVFGVNTKGYQNLLGALQK